MKKIPNWCIIGLIFSIIILLFSYIIFDKQSNEFKANIIPTSVTITDVDVYTTGDETSTYYTTVATFIDSDKECTVEMSGKDYSVGDTIEVYKYSDKYYINPSSITMHTNPLVFILMILGIFGTFFFFPLQIYFNIKKRH